MDEKIGTMWSKIKHGLGKVFIGLSVYLVVSVVAALFTNLILLNRMDERVQAIEYSYKQQDKNFASDLWHYESWLRAITQKVDALQPRVIQVEARVEYTQHCLEELKKRLN